MAEQKTFPPQRAEDPGYRGCGRLCDKVALITGGDRGIGRAVAVAFAKEGAAAAIVYLNEHQDAEEFCSDAVERTVKELGRLDILVNNAAEQHEAACQGVIVAFTRSLAQQLAGKQVRVNAVAPGPVWTPLIPATFPRGEIAGG